VVLVGDRHEPSEEPQHAVVAVVGLFLLGVPYALVLGAFVSVAAVIPYLGAWLSAIPAVIVALTVSPTTAFMTALLFPGHPAAGGQLPDA